MSTPKTEDDLKSLQKKIKYSTIGAVVIVAVVFCSYIGYLGIYNDLSLSTDSGIWGSFGDFIGGLLNPIIAGLAFYWLTQSVLIQKKELSDTQSVLADTEKTQRIQRFENSFFSLLEQMNTVFSQLNSPDHNQTISTNAVSRQSSSSKLSRLYKEVNDSSPSIGAMFIVFRNNSSEINHYYRIIYQLLKFILTNNGGSDNYDKSFDSLLLEKRTPSEKFYSNIVRSFLNKEVTFLLAINCINLEKTKFSNGDEYINFHEFRKLIERYEILEHIEQLEFTSQLTNFYDEKAFGKNPIAIKIYAKKKQYSLTN